MKDIEIYGASQGNLQHIDVKIPRNQITGICGLSGSGKSTLAIQVLFQECQRQYLEALGMQGIQKPEVVEIKQVTPAVLINQKQDQLNPRSSLGTLTNIYTDLRMIYEKLGTRTCPRCHQRIHSDECKEETKKIDGDFHVYEYCSACKERIDKLTRSHFSYNTREGACPTCQGLGHVLAIDQAKVVDEHKSLEAGAVALWEQAYQEYMINVIKQAFSFYELPYQPGTPIQEFTELQKRILYDGVACEAVQQEFPGKLPRTQREGRMEGILPALYRKYAEKGGVSKQLAPYFIQTTCPVCHGERLNEESRAVVVNGKRLPKLVTLSLNELHEWILDLQAGLQEAQRTLVHVYLYDLETKIKRIDQVGLGYLSLNRQTMTLSGGEIQRIHLSAALDSELTGILYILDEPTRGLHPQDTKGIVKAIQALKDKGNTVVVIEHDLKVLEALDHVIEIGPGSGSYGGRIIAQGSWQQILQNPSSVTGAYLQQQEPPYQPKQLSDSRIQISHASTFNLKDVSVTFYSGACNVVCGVSGSGKSTLIYEELAKNRNATGLEQFDQIVLIEQKTLTRMKRSNIATSTKLFEYIRKCYASLHKAKELGLTASSFSFNSAGGRCENCEGMGTITSNLLFFQDVELTCPICHGKQFHKDVLQVQYQGYDIHELLQLSVAELLPLFAQHKKLAYGFQLLIDVGLGYLRLGQSLTTLSSGEAQRLKLARELMESKKEKRLYLIDEPTVGLHPVDIQHFLLLLHRLCEQGNTCIIIEHDPQVIRQADWIVELGPQGGIEGGEVIAMGSLDDILSNPKSVTAPYLIEF